MVPTMIGKVPEPTEMLRGGSGIWVASQMNRAEKATKKTAKAVSILRSSDPRNPDPPLT